MIENAEGLVGGSMNHHFPALLVDVFRLSLWLMALVVVFLPLERLFAVHPHKIFRKGIVADLCYYFLNSLLPAVLLGVPVGLLAWVTHRIVPGGVPAAMAALPLWARVAAGLVAGEFGYYWGHRWSHEIPFLWRFHSVHHSAEDMDFLVHTRAHPIDMVFGRFCGLVPIYVLGLGSPANMEGSVVPVVSILIGTAWGFFIHANLRWRFGPLEWLISTPAFHHWHHTRSGPIDRNFSSTLPWLDWLFGSLYLPKGWPEDYGIKAKMPEALIDQLAYPLFPPAPERVPGQTDTRGMAGVSQVEPPAPPGASVNPTAVCGATEPVHR
jgi:sterol desaturase/sphingolipid hydroxylase (fatty acid hydroxylase superfamily)